MKLADSCVWIEILAEGPLAERFTPMLADLTGFVVPTIVLHEVHKWAAVRRGSRSLTSWPVRCSAAMWWT